MAVRTTLEIRSPPLDVRLRASDISVMTEKTDIEKALPLAIEQFVLHWGDMGGQWGVNRSVSQIHALLYVSERPLTADDISTTLGIARSNVSNSIKQLLAWSLIRRLPVKGDRRDHYEAETDIWEIAIRIAAGRKAREIDPAVATLRTCVGLAERDPTVNPVTTKRLKDMLAFTESVDVWSTQMMRLPSSKLAALMRLGTKIITLLPLGRVK